jgi:hypothetical protein
MFQWGRADEGVEDFILPPFSFSLLNLHWGHTDEGVETRVVARNSIAFFR